MSNASRALLIVGSVLIAVILISVLVRTVSNISEFQKAQLTEEELESLIAFNEQYVGYTNEYVYGTEVITAIHRILSNKIYPITINVKFNSSGNGYSYSTTVYNAVKKKYEQRDFVIAKGTTVVIKNYEENSEAVKNFISSLDKSAGLNQMAFKCTKITYDANGRVNGINFEEKLWGELR